MKATIYCRLSEDKYGTELGVQRQEEECREFVSGQGWTVREVLVDNDLSATSGVKRPEFERLLKSEPEVVVCWHTDRLLRTTKDLERMIDLGVDVHGVRAGHIDLSTPSGRAVARTVTAWSTYEGEQKAERQRASHRQRVKSGKPWWSNRPFGFEKDGSHREEEAEVLRTVFQQLLEGASLTRAAKFLNEGGFLTPRGNKWAASHVKNLVTHPRNAGIYVYKGEEVGEGAWEPIVSEDVFRATARVLNDPSRTTNFGKGGVNQRENLLTGIAECHRCGSTVRVGRSYNNRTREYNHRTYQCTGCRGTTIRADWCDGIVLHKVMNRVSEWADRLPASSGDDVDTDALRTEEAALRSRKEELGELFSEGAIDRQTLASGVARADEKLGDITETLANAAESAADSHLFDPETLWQFMENEDGTPSVERMTPIVRRLCNRIVLKGPGKGKSNTLLMPDEHLWIEWANPEAVVTPAVRVSRSTGEVEDATE